MQPNFAPVNNNLNNAFKLAAFAMVLIYLVGCFTPLHVHFDSIRYFDMKDCIEFGCPPDAYARRDYLPYGYTGLLILLSKLGVLGSFSIIFINCLYLFAGLYFVKKIFAQQVHPVLLITITLFNWALIKFVQHPLAEMQYIFFSAAGLYCFHLYTQQKGNLYLGLAFLFAILTMLTRTVGISLVAALFAAVAWQHRKEIQRIFQKNKWMLIMIAVICAGMIFFARQLKIVDYTVLLKGPLENGLFHFIGENLKKHFREWSELFVNMPSTKWLGFLPPRLGPALFISLGVGVFAWFLYTLFAKKSQLPFYIRVYIVFYSFIIFNWPYYDVRFWLPVFPLIVAILLRTPFNSRPWLKKISRLYLGAYLAAGIFAAGYALWMGFDKEELAKKQGSGIFRNEYEVYFFGKPLSDTATYINQHVIDILKKYD